MNTPKLSAIAIEINSSCNRKCKMCPNGHYSRSPGFLEEILFDKVLSELKEGEFTGKFTFNMFNEPLLDYRLPRFISQVRKTLPKSFIYLNTNGDFLDMDIWKSMREAGLNYTNVTRYNGDIPKEINEIVVGLKDGEKQTLCIHSFDKINTINRAGLVKTKRNISLPIKSSCSRPFFQMNINYIGEIVICCNDYFGKVVAGNVRKDNIWDIWSGEVFKNYREKLSRGERGSLDLCKNCDWENA